MSIINFIPQIWAGSILRELEKSLVYGSCVNRDYEKDMIGDQVHINELSDITVNNYTGSVSYESLDSASQSFVLDQEKYFAFKIGDIDKAQANPSLIGKASSKAAYSVGDTIDQYIASFYSTAGITSGLGTDGTPIEINSSNVDTYLIKLARMLDDNKVKRMGRFVVIPPWMLEDLVLADIGINTNNTGIIANGLVGQFAGFEIKVSNNVPNTTSTKYKIIAGTNDAITYAQQVKSIEGLRLEDEFSDAIRGLTNYGAKVIQPDALACLTANEAAEA